MNDVLVISNVSPTVPGHGGGEGFDVHRQRGVRVAVPAGHLAHHVEDGGPRALGVVQVGEGVGEAGP